MVSKDSRTEVEPQNRPSRETKPVPVGRHRANILLGVALFATTAAPAIGQVNIAQAPLFLMMQVPGNLVLVPSVEYPTINSVANLGDYTPDKVYAGYFDPDKCYLYSYDKNEQLRHFYPSAKTSNRRCSNNAWSGNFLNWATTQTIDPFRSGLTGGYRVRDTATETWLEKARHDGQGGDGLFPNRRLPASGNNATLVSGATPFSNNWMRMRIQGLGNQMQFSLVGEQAVDSSADPYNPTQTVRTGRAYTLSVRVKVCDPNVGVEPNCRKYSQGWKPEGTLQEYADGMRYSVFGYLNDHSFLRDGGVLRARQKWIGPTKQEGGRLVTNSEAEWDAGTGVLVRNPNKADADATNATISDSGVINYLNKFGQMTTRNHKNHDPVSELYYSAIRYLKKQTNIPEYSSLTGTATERGLLADGFPVITSWDDPVLHWCQNNVILGIGDIYSHRDKNLPGGTRNNDEPARPSAVSGDATVNVHTATQKVAQLEGININVPFTGRENSAYIAGLAYDSHTKDMRPDLTGGKVTASTYWVDVLEAQSLEGMGRNQYALAAKYGGFRVPEDFEPYSRADPLPVSWWHSNGETLTPFGGQGAGQARFLRPDNFFTAGDAAQMIESLKKAFKQAYTEMTASRGSGAASSAVLRTDMLLYATSLRSTDWSGNLVAREIDQVSGEATTEKWNAEAIMANADPDERNLLTMTEGGGKVSLKYEDNNLGAAQRAALNINGLGAARVAWLRGTEHASLRDRSPEGQDGVRRIGDLVNSAVHFMGRKDYGYSLFAGEMGTSYRAFRLDEGYRSRPDVVFVGSNGGFLHAFHAGTPYIDDGQGGKRVDPDGGSELFAYMPSELLLPEPGGGTQARINELMAPDYVHRFFVDGTATTGDAYLGGSWKTILLGAMGVGGRTVFAMDVTEPKDVDPSDVLWEFKYADADCTAGVSACREIGYGVTQSTVGRLSDGTWVAIFGNGYNSHSHKAQLFVVNLGTGRLVELIDTGSGDANNPNGLSAVTVTDWPSEDLSASRAYAGDLQGNIWRFALTGTRGAAKLFTATDNNAITQPITARPTVQVLPGDNERVVVAVGTGSYFREEDGDMDSPQVQSLYGVFDTVTGVTEVTRGGLLEQVISTNAEEVTLGKTSYPINGLRFVTANQLSGQAGWRLDLPVEGERVVSEAFFPSGAPRTRIRFATLIPDEDPCGSGRTGFFMDIDLTTGGRSATSVFDLNQDGEIDDNDLVDGEVVSGIGGGSGERPMVVQRPDSGIDIILGSDGGKIVESRGAPSGRRAWQQLR